MTSVIELLVSTELHRILKAEWLAAFVEAHNGAFSTQNIQGVVFCQLIPRKFLIMLDWPHWLFRIQSLFEIPLP